MAILDQIADGRTDLVFDYLAHGNAATATDKDGVPLIKWCAYFGDVSAIRFLLANGESLSSLAGELASAAFHGHWRLCQFLLAARSRSYARIGMLSGTQTAARNFPTPEHYPCIVV